MIGVMMFAVALLLLLAGFPVAFTFAGVAVAVGVLTQGPELFAFMPYRILSIMQNTVLMAIPLFIFMGIVLQKTKMAEQLLEAMGQLLGPVRGGLAIATVLVGALLAASTGVVGASVVAMGLICLPVMLKYRYDPMLSTGVICASGTLGQIIPPSIVLIILGDVLGLPVGDLFQAAVLPGCILVGLYILYIVIRCACTESLAPALPQARNATGTWALTALYAMLPPLLLMAVVLGSIFTGIATPTESSALGCLGAIVLAYGYQLRAPANTPKPRTWAQALLRPLQTLGPVLYTSAKDCASITAMVFAILIGATAFSMVFSYTGGDALLEHWLTQLPGEKWGFLGLTLLLILLLGFFIDFVEISFIIVPILAPVAQAMGLDMLWFAILIALNLQTSFLTPPFGFSLFYLKGVAPPDISTQMIYRGVIPFILMQVSVLIAVLLWPQGFGFA